MANDLIRVDYAVLQQIALTFDQAGERVRQGHDSVVGHTDVLKNGGWTGDAADSYYREMEDDVLPSLGRLVEALAAAGDTIRLIAKMMHEAEEEAAACLRADLEGLSETTAGERADGRRYKSDAEEDPLPVIMGEGGTLILRETDTEGIDLGILNLGSPNREVPMGTLFEQENSIGTLDPDPNVVPGILTGANNAWWDQAWAQWQNRIPLDPAANNAMMSSYFSQRSARGGGIGWGDAVAIALLALLGSGFIAQAAAVASTLAQEALNRWQDGGFSLLPPARPGDNILDNPQNSAPPDEQEYIPLDDELSDQMNAPESIPMQEGQGIDVLADPLVEEQSIQILASRTQQELDDLARDPSRGNEITPKGIYERQIGLDLEARGDLPGPITRDTGGGAEFVDANGVLWDIKSFNSNFPLPAVVLRSIMLLDKYRPNSMLARTSF